MNVKRGDVYADLSPVVGSEQGVRPVLVIQNDIGNKCSYNHCSSYYSQINKAHYLPMGNKAHEYVPKDSVVL